MTVYYISHLNEKNAKDIITWRYDPPYDLYDLDTESLGGLLNPEFRYHQVLDEQGILIGYCCFGFDAQVPGGDYQINEPAVLDIGVGMNPALTGQGRGAAFVRSILDFGLETFQPEIFRATVAKFNQRSLRTFLNVGFKLSGNFIRELIDIEFLQLEKSTKE